MSATAENRNIALKCIMTVAIILLVYARQPDLLTTPRFWAEEGTDYFSYAFNHSWLDNIFFPQYGYNTLYNSLATSLAAAVPLEHAPLITIWLAFCAQIAVSAAVVWWNIPVLDSLWKKFVIAVLIQTLAYVRIWLTTIGVQYWLCVLSFLILLCDYRITDRRMPYFHHVLLFLNGLTGILSCVLIPAFAYKYVVTRSRLVLHQTVILISCLAVQIGIFLHAYLNKSAGLINRFTNSDFTYIMSKILKFEFSTPFVGIKLYESDTLMNAETALRSMLSHVVGPAIMDTQYDLIEVTLGILIFCFLTAMSVKMANRLETRLILISIIGVTIISTCFSINRSSGPRYTFAPTIMILVLVVTAINDRTIPALFRYLATTLVVLSVVTSLSQYRRIMNFAFDESWPCWQFEVYKWHCDPGYQLEIWPPGWHMKLDAPPRAAGD